MSRQTSLDFVAPPPEPIGLQGMLVALSAELATILTFARAGFPGASIADIRQYTALGEEVRAEMKTLKRRITRQIAAINAGKPSRGKR